jgi:hypothetical protein
MEMIRNFGQNYNPRAFLGRQLAGFHVSAIPNAMRTTFESIQLLSSQNIDSGKIFFVYLKHSYICSPILKE